MAKNDTVRRALVARRSRRGVLTPALSRGLDLTLAGLAAVFLAPLIFVVAIAIALERDGPVLFAHPRVGRGGRIIRVLKFRSMRIDADAVLARHLAADPAAAEEWARDHKLRQDPRVTRIGAFLRKSSLDELPQLWNVVRGEMSLVGPRPIVAAEAVRYGRWFENYCSVRPGITGIWQVSGRNDVSYRRRVAMDALYARHKCVTLDLKLMLATIPAVLARKGSY